MRNYKILKKTNRIFLILLIFIFCFANASFSDEGETSAQNEPVENKSILIRLGRTHFDPLKRLPEQKAGINHLQAYEEGKTGYYIVQFDGPIHNSWKEALKDTGADIFDYIPEFAFIIRMDSQQEQAVRALPHVRWLGIYQPSYKISQGALNKTFTLEQEQGVGVISYETLRITVFPDEDLSQINSQIAALGGTILDTVTTKWKTTLKIKAPVNRISDLPLIQGIKWVEPVPEWKLFNNVSTDIMTVRNPRDSFGLYGEGQTVGVCDTGLDQGSTNPASLHNDFEDGSGASRVTQIIDVAGDGPQDVNSGHGTHVAGSVLGNGIRSGSTPSSNTFPGTCFAGIAPKANLVFQAVENNSTQGLDLPSDLNTLFSQSDGAGADLHTNSWGASAGGMYSSYSQDVDEYIWDHKDFLILFSAGNEGIDMDGDGVIDLNSLGAPATAKNCLTVGASEGNRPSGAGYDTPWGTGSWAVKYSAEPIFSDHVSDDPVGIAAFSSRGPVIDGRYKPDLVAPGTNILSARSSVASGTGWGTHSNINYIWMGGTSMSTPLTAGASALMREYLIKVRGYTTPSAALIKAALLNSAEDISPGQYGTGVDQEIPDAPVPNNVEGWGRLNIENGVYPLSPFNILYYDEPTGLGTGGNQDYTINVSTAGSPLKINLVWTDYPGSTAAQGGLVNDLDLQVTDPSMTVLYPDNASQKSIVSQLSYDNDNTNYWYDSNRQAMRFTPAIYPAYLESATFFFVDVSDPPTVNNVNVIVYADAGGLPGAPLLTKTLTYVPSGWATIGLGVTITSGDFYISVETTTADQGLLIDNTNPTGRSYYHTGSAWAVSPGTSYIRANVRGTDHSTPFDRVNNVLGLTIDPAVVGTYTIRVSGYNVPQGPQPYALVVSGRASDTDPPSIVEYPSINFANNTIDIAYDEPAMQNATAETNYSFSPSIDFATASPTDDNITHIGGSTYRLSMAPITEYEIYTLTVTALITDLAGNSVDNSPIRINDNENDSMADDWETEYGLNTTIDDRTDDLDSDGYTNYEEYVSRTDPSSASSMPVAITDSTPQNNAGIPPSTTRVPNNSSFAVMIRSAQGIDLTNTASINFTIDDDVNPSYTRNLGSAFVRTIILSGGPTQATSLWAVYDRSLDVYGTYDWDVDVNITVDATDINAISMTTAIYNFNIETLTEHNEAHDPANLPVTSATSDPTDLDRDSGTQVDSGDLEGATILYDSSEPIEPYFGPLDEVPAINLSGANSVAVPMNLQPPTVFDTPVRLLIPCPGLADVSNLSVYYYNGEDWVMACNANGDVLPGGEGWMVPGSRVDHNNGSPSTIEIQVYHFSGAQAGLATSSPPPDGGGGGGGGTCFISTAASGL